MIEEKEYSAIHPSNKIHPTAIIAKNVTLGVGNVIGAYTVIGSNGEIRGAKDFQGTIVIGDYNVIREHVTIQRPYAKNRETVIGSAKNATIRGNRGSVTPMGPALPPRRGSERY